MDRRKALSDIQYGPTKTLPDQQRCWALVIAVLGVGHWVVGYWGVFGWSLVHGICIGVENNIYSTIGIRRLHLSPSCARMQAHFLSAVPIWALAVSSGCFDGLVARGMPQCASDLKRFVPRVHKRKYTVAIHATEGFDVALTTYNKTFSEYLTATAGKRFDTPLEFEVVPVNFEDLMQGIDDEVVDFMFSNPSTYTCVGVEEGARPLATIVERLDVSGIVYETDTFAGVMFTLAENEDISGVEDFKDKVIGAVGVSVLNAGLTQFYEMSVAGTSFVMDPKQVTFTGNQNDVVSGVISGEFDVGFVRTGQIERYRDTAGRSINRDTFKVLQPKIHVQADGNLFPFLHSTETFPEYLVSALDFTPHDVVDEVRDALLALRAHAEAWKLLGQCESSFFADCDIQVAATRCDTTIEVARLAATAARDGHFFGFRSPKSYFDVRSIQQAVGFMDIDKKGNWQCTKHQTLFEKLPCPEFHYKLSEEDFENSCSRHGLQCKEEYSCYCKPCVKTHEVEVFQYSSVNNTASTEVRRGCDKMDLCGTIEQTKTITFRIIDNLKREGVSVGATIHVDDTHDKTAVETIANETFTYEFSWTGNSTGIVLLEVDFDDEYIAESPLRFEVVDRDCAIEFPGRGTAPSLDGECVCTDGLSSFGRCLGRATITTGSCIAALLLILVAGNLLLRHRTRQIDALWQIEIDELAFEDPPVVIGQGSFGVVIRAEYRGINVAIKRAVRPEKASRYGSTNFRQSSAYQMGQDASEKDGCPDFDRDEENVPETNMLEMARTGTSGGNLSFLRQFRARKRGFINFRGSTEFSRSHLKATMFGDTVSQTTQKNMLEQTLPCFDPQRKRAKNFMREMRVLSRLRPVVVNPRDPMLVMEYLEYGSLTEGLLQNGTLLLTGEIIVQVARDVIQGLRYLHSTNPPILHGDLKGKNILIDARFRAKLCDFGLSTKKKNEISGTPYWLPPEYLVGDSEYTKFCDIYSFGVVLYEMYSRKSPYEGLDFEKVLKEVCNPRIKRRPKITPSTPTRMAELMKKCWNVNPFNRPNARDLDTTMMDMQAVDAEPLSGQGSNKHPKLRTGDMLYEIFPKHIADTLKAGKKPDAEHHDLCTIVFSDIVGFTSISREISPLKVSEMLDRLYLAFDEIATKHNVFKMETIGTKIAKYGEWCMPNNLFLLVTGDAYMGVTNLQGDQTHNHVKVVAEFAVDMIKVASRILVDEEDPSRGVVQIRVGFHSGPVVSNVIGTLNPRYGLFGDTVNTANRMESNSKAGRILCSEHSHNLLKEQAPGMRVRRRGKIDVKGRGEMKVFWVGDSLEGEMSFSQSVMSSGQEGFHVSFHESVRSLVRPHGKFPENYNESSLTLPLGLVPSSEED